MSQTARPVYFIGDSNTIAFRYLALRDSKSDESIVTATYRVRASFCAELFSDDGLEPGLQSFFRRRIAGHTPPTPVVVILFGTVDVASILAEIGPATEAFSDHALPAPYSSNIPFPLLPNDLLAGLIERRFAPLEAALSRLVADGSARIVLHNIHPPTTSNMRYAVVRNVLCSAQTRYATVAAVNRHLQKIAARSGVAFLNVWEHTIKDGVLDERLSLDGDHLNYEGALITLKALIEAGLT